MRLRTQHVKVFVGLCLWLQVTQVPGQNTGKVPIRGYGDRLSVQAGEEISFMVSSQLPGYRADIVRLIHGDTNPKGPGFKEELIQTPISGDYSGRNQSLRPGSYVIVPDSSRLRLKDSLTLQAWIAPPTPSKGVQGILTKWSGREGTGYGLFIDEDGSLALWLGDANGRIEKFSTGVPLRASPAARVYQSSPDDHPNHQMVTLRYWTFVAATFDASSGRVALYQQPGKVWPGDGNGPVEAEISTSLRSIGVTTAPLLMAALWEHRNGESETAGYFNGKIENPRIFDRALTKEEMVLFKGGMTPRQPLAQWDLAADIQLRRVRDLSPNNFHGRTVNMPMKGATGHGWSGKETNFNLAPEAYGAIYFHDDDLDDAGWEVDFQFHVPADLKSGVYAARLRTDGGEDYIPFFVRPRRGTATARIAFLVPTFSYLAYGAGPGLLSLYSFHSDGSGACYASRLRPLTNMRPKRVETWQGVELVHQFNADLHLEGSELLAPYQVVITGSHPEYWSEQMLDGLETYLGKGGRLMYLGGNGFYWVTSLDSEQQHTIEIRRHHGTELWQAAPGEYYLSTTGDAELNPTGKSGVYGGFQSWIDRPGRTRSLGDGQVDFGGICSRLAQYDYDGWAVLEWECVLKHPEDGAREGAAFIRDHIIRVTETAFDDFSSGDVDRKAIDRMLGLG